MVIQGSDGYPQGSHKIKKVVASIGGFDEPHLLTATKFRHRAEIQFSETSSAGQATVKICNINDENFKYVENDLIGRLSNKIYNLMKSAKEAVRKG